MYHAYIGDIHPMYGGKLTDIMSLPYGTVFKVTNGSWTGKIDYDKHTDKAVHILETNNTVKITNNNRYLYIINYQDNNNNNME